MYGGYDLVIIIFFKMLHLTYNQKESILDDISNKMSYRNIYYVSRSAISRFFKNVCQAEQNSFLSQW